MPLFSIIVPVYNKEKTLSQCIDSVIRQKCQDWELILINDGSNDGSERTIKQYNDNRIRYFSHANRGVSYTRNRGIREAFGKYVMFLDADDYWGEDFLQNIEEGVNANSADIYFTGITKLETNGERTILQFPYEGIVDGQLFRSTFYEIQRTTQLYGYVANKIIRRAILNKYCISFDEAICMAEDLDFYLRCYPKCHVLCFLKECGYYYVMYQGGTSMFKRDVDYFSLIGVQKKMKLFCDGYMSVDDMRYYAIIMKDLAQSAISETSPLRIQTIPDKVRQINEDNEISRYYQVRDNVVVLMCKVFLHQLYVRIAQKMMKLCGR